MRNNFIIIFFLLCCQLLHGQQYKNCNIYQYAGNDSIKKFVSLKRLFNASGQIIKETYNKYKTTASDGHMDCTYSYYYKDTLLVKRTSIDNENDRTKVLYYYNEKNQLIKEEHFTFERRLKKGVTGDVLSDNDFKIKRTWLKTRTIKYSYNKKGQRILYDETSLHYTSQNRYTWTYDDLGRIQKYSSFDNERLIWVEDFSYFTDGYKYTRTWYDASGNPLHLNKEGGYWPQYTFTCKTNDDGQIIRKDVTNESNEKGGTEITIYNSKKQIERFESFSENSKLEITHIYIYF